MPFESDVHIVVNIRLAVESIHIPCLKKDYKLDLNVEFIH